MNLLDKLLLGDINSNRFEKIILSICGVLTAVAAAITIYLTYYYPVIIYHQ